MSSEKASMSAPVDAVVRTVAEARERRICRVCGTPMGRGGGKPAGWEFEFGEMLWPEAITLKYGDEFAHTKCL